MCDYLAVALQQSHSPRHRWQQLLKGLLIPPRHGGQLRPETHHVDHLAVTEARLTIDETPYQSKKTADIRRNQFSSWAKVGEDTLDETAPHHYSQPQGTSYPGCLWPHPLVSSPDCPGVQFSTQTDAACTWSQGNSRVAHTYVHNLKMADYRALWRTQCSITFEPILFCKIGSI